MEFSLAEIIALCAMMVGANGGTTWAVMHVHLKYIKETNERHEVRLNDHSRRLQGLELLGAGK